MPLDAVMPRMPGQYRADGTESSAVCADAIVSSFTRFLEAGQNTPGFYGEEGGKEKLQRRIRMGDQAYSAIRTRQAAARQRRSFFLSGSRGQMIVHPWETVNSE